MIRLITLSDYEKAADHSLTYNCKQPGHESSACEEPRSAEQRQCFNCGATGHIVADCPILQQAGLSGGGASIDRGAVKCYACGQMGHISKHCPSNDVDTSGYAGDSSSPTLPNNGVRLVKCYRCGGMNHFARDCVAPGPNNSMPSRPPRVCFHCQKVGHIARECPEAATANNSRQPAQDGATEMPNVASLNIGE